MVHMLKILKCKRGHILPISIDMNECGCHHDGKPCIIINCTSCFKEMLESGETGLDSSQIVIALDEEGLKKIKEKCSE